MRTPTSLPGSQSPERIPVVDPRVRGSLGAHPVNRNEHRGPSLPWKTRSPSSDALWVHLPAAPTKGGTRPPTTGVPSRETRNRGVSYGASSAPGRTSTSSPSCSCGRSRVVSAGSRTDIHDPSELAPADVRPSHCLCVPETYLGRKVSLSATGGQGVQGGPGVAREGRDG